MAEAKVGDVTARLSIFMEDDALDFQKTGRAVLIVEDEVAELPLPKGDPGEKGDRGEPGRTIPDLVLDESTDGLALQRLQDRSRTWSDTDERSKGYFAYNKPTRSGFFYTRGGWVRVLDVFGGSTEIVAGEFTIPTLFRNQANEPGTPVDGVVLFAQGGSLKMKKPNGTVVTLG